MYNPEIRSAAAKIEEQAKHLTNEQLATALVPVIMAMTNQDVHIGLNSTTGLILSRSRGFLGVEVFY